MYEELTIYVIENGYLLKISVSHDAKNLVSDTFTTTYYPDKKRLIEALKKAL